MNKISSRLKKILIAILSIIILIILFFILKNYNLKFLANSIVTSTNSIKINSHPVEISKSGNIEYSVSNDGTSGTISYTNSLKSGWIIYSVSGLERNKVYKASSIIKTTINNYSNQGITIGTSRYIENFTSITFSWDSTIKYTNTTGIKKNVYFISDPYGKATITIGTPCHGNIGAIIGNVSFSDFSINEATSDEIHVQSSANNKIKIIMKKEDCNNINSSNPISSIQSFLNKMEDVYNSYAELSGQNSLNHGLLYPFEADTVVIMYPNQHEYGAIAGYPIEVSSIVWKASDAVNEFLNYGSIPWGELHELGHLFDNKLTTVDKSISNNAGSWNFATELWACYKSLYSIQTGVVNTKINHFDDFERMYKEGLGKATDKKYDEGSLLYLLLQAKNSAGITDWEGMKKTLKWFNDLKDTTITNSTAKRFALYVKKYTDFSSAGYYNLYEVFMNRREELDIILENLSYRAITSLSLENNNMELGINNTYQEKVQIKPANKSGVLVYESSNEKVAKVDDFGNITAVGYGDAKIKIYSLFEPNIVVYKNIKVNDYKRKIDYITNCSAIIDSYIGKINDEVVLPNVVANGYEFLGWYSDSTLKNKIGVASEKIKLSDNIKLYAKVKKVSNSTSTKNETVNVKNTYKTISKFIYIFGLFILCLGIFIVHKSLKERKHN